MINDNNSNLINFHKIPNSNRSEVNHEVLNSLLQSSSSNTQINHQISAKIKLSYNYDIKHKLSLSEGEYQLIKNYKDSINSIEPVQLQQQPSYLKNEYKIDYKYGLKYHQDSPSDIEFIQFLEQQLEYLKWARNLLHVQGGPYAGLPLELRVTILDKVTSSCHLLSPSMRRAIVDYALDKATLPKRDQADSECKNAFFKAVNNKKTESAETKNVLKLASI